MTARSSIDVPGLSHHGLPIPAGSRVGPLLVTGGVRGVDRATGVMPEDVSEQCRLMFHNLRAIVEAGGGNSESIAKVTVWIANADARESINKEWLRMFPNPASRPARHILAYALPRGMLVQCEAMAYVPNQ
jgi:2-iminobutanoate/2-iminopropanoate deaminase